ncbi:MAG: hypothetical protein LBG77_08825 [Dysgonamonadaceae bacterium]|nr:hypothetical protein [Dysgonamonadaceae bacterium]
MTRKEKNVVKAYSTILGDLSYGSRIALVDNLLSSLKKETSNDEFIPEKSAEEIIAELRESRSFGHTRMIESFD